MSSKIEWRKNWNLKTNILGSIIEGLHAFRHTHAVLMLEAGVSLLYLSKRLRHKNTKTTSETYSHITEKIEKDELAKFASYTSR